MIITLVEALLVFFIFGAKWVINFLFSSLAYSFTKDKRYQIATLTLVLYQNFWILDTLKNAFNNFNLVSLLSVISTEIVLYGLAYVVILIMSFFSQSQTNYINYPGALITSVLAIPTIEFIINLLHSIIPIIIV